MARVVVAGGGYGGLAASVRLAKLGHSVTLVEARTHVGGALERVTRDEFAWDVGPTHTLLPAVARDLFRKSGRPLERELELEHLNVVREHRFDDGTTLRLPSSSLERQTEAVEAFSPGSGAAWAAHVGAYAATWETLRREYLERPWASDLADRSTNAVLFPRETLHRRARRGLRDPRLREVVTHPVIEGGHDPRQVPVWVGMSDYLAQRFGVWRVAAEHGGMAALGAALEQRLSTRKVTVQTQTRVLDLLVRSGHVVGVSTDAGELDADIVVVATDPRRLPVLARHVGSTVPAVPAPTLLVGLRDEDLPELEHETVVHGDGVTFTITTNHLAPAGHRAWRVSARGRLHDDLLDALAREGIDVRLQATRRMPLSPREQVERWGGSPWGVLWQGRGTTRARVGPDTPIPGVYAVGSHATPGAGLPFTGLGAAVVATEIGPA